jgi:hypothetical protein
MMTTGAMVLGALPLALATGAGAESRRQIGWVIVGGMSLGTLLTIFVVPTMYTLACASQDTGRQEGSAEQVTDIPHDAAARQVARAGQLRRGGGWPSDGAVEHHHIDFVTGGHVALAVVQHDQAVGLHHGAEHARALVAGGAHLQTPSAPALTMPRWYSVRPAFLRMGSGCCARAAAVAGGHAPIMRSRAGRTNARKVTITATGLPGKPNSIAPTLPAGADSPWGGPAAMRPTAIGRPGRMAMRQNATSPSFFIMALV